MILFVAFFLALLALVLFVPVFVLLMECLLAWLYPTSANRVGKYAGSVRKAIVIPAHNEEMSIGRTVSHMLTELQPGDHLIVVADNCSDSTAAVASELGATVLERNDVSRRGKGFALDHALQHLSDEPPDVVVFVDADCVMSPGGPGLLALVAHTEGRPAQSNNIMQSPDSIVRPGLKIAEFAWMLRGFVRPTGLDVMGMPCQLYGTGMAIPWSVLKRHSFASGEIVEDMKLTVDLIDGGVMPIFCSDVAVISQFPTTEKASTEQRQRWEHGHLATIVKYGLPTLGRALIKLDPRRVMLALDICVPPLSLFVMLLTMVLVLSALIVLFFDMAWVALMVSGLASVLLALSLLLVWLKFGREILNSATLLKIPGYIFGKLAIYSRFFTNRHQEWNRADRK